MFQAFLLSLSQAAQRGIQIGTTALGAGAATFGAQMVPLMQQAANASLLALIQAMSNAANSTTNTANPINPVNTTNAINPTVTHV